MFKDNLNIKFMVNSKMSPSPTNLLTCQCYMKLLLALVLLFLSS